MTDAARAERTGLVLAAIVALPVLVGIAYALTASIGLAGAGAVGFTTAHVASVVRDAGVWRGVAWSLWIAAVSTALATGIAVGVATLFRGANSLDRVGRALAIMPLPVPHIVAALLGVQMLGQSGILSRAAHAVGLAASPAAMPALIYDPYGIGVILTMTWKEAPFLAVVAIAVLASRGSAEEDAARTLGASPGATFRRITLPLLLRGLLGAIVAVFVFAAGNYEVAALLAPSDPLAMPLLIEERATDPDLARRGAASVVALIGVAIGAVAVAVHAGVTARWRERLA